MDSQARETALQCDQSFIVQAPAGSGKTELLVQRYLALLAHRAENPHQVLAITFTKKAAEEMVSRIQLALQQAKNNVPCEPHQLKTRALANLVLEKESKLGWHLLALKSQIRCMTFDGFCQHILGKQAITSQKTPAFTVSENPNALYDEAITLWLEKKDPALTPMKQALLTLFDNRVYILKQKLLAMLQSREAWLPMVHEFKTYFSESDPDALIQVIRQHVEGEQEGIVQRVTERLNSYVDTLLPLLAFSFANLGRDLSESFLEDLLPLLLTQQDEFRKKLDKNTGFPAKDKSAPDNEIKKQEMLALLDVMAFDEALHQSLLAYKYRPEWDEAFAFQHTQIIIQALYALFESLQEVFMKRGEADFQDFALKALLALGDASEPSDVCLQILTEIKHVLVDEFQDTSQSQWDLLAKMVAGWPIEDNNTLFLVGDPMQSIYRFRNAKVGFFLRARTDGVADIKLDALFLQQNFRSSSTLVDWFNDAFSQHFGEQDDSDLDRVAFSKAFSNKHMNDSGVVFKPENTETRTENWISQEIKTLLAHDPAQSIAILVRQRNGLAGILQALNEADIPYQGIGLVALCERQWVLDWLSWLTVLCDPLDNMAWCALLRSPLVGCTNAELARLYTESEGCIYTVINEFNADPLRLVGWCEALRNPTSDVKSNPLENLKTLIHIFKTTQTALSTQSMQQAIECSWQALQGNGLLPHQQAHDDIALCLNALDTFKALRGLALIKAMTTFTETHRSHAEVKVGAVQVMTIHQAKGLEFDHVFLPDGENILKPGRDDRELLRFETISHEDNRRCFLISSAPPKRSPDAVYRYLQWREKLKSAEEAKRLFYVAVTRAKKGLYL